MKSIPPLLSPLLRSDAQGRILTALFGHPERSYTLTELAAAAEVTVPTIMREVDRLIEAEYLIDEPVGRARQIRANEDHPLFIPLWQILMSGYGPVAILPSMLSKVSHIEEAYIYGSWAARYLGEPGSPPNDIDVLIVGGADYGDVYAVAQQATELFGREVSVQTVSSKRWHEESDGFVQTVKSHPLIQLNLENT